MKKTIAAAAALLLGFAAGAQAGIHIALFAGYATTPGSGAGDGVLIGGRVGFSLSKMWSLEITAGRWQLPLPGTTEGLSKGKITETPVELELRAHIPLGARGIRGYAAAGAGYAMHSFALDSTIVGGWRTAGLEVNESVDHGLAAHLGLGVEITLGPAAAVEIGARYSILRTKGTWAMADQAGGESVGGTLAGLAFDALAVVAGFRVAFR